MVRYKNVKLIDIFNWQPQKEIDPLKIPELSVGSGIKYPFYGQATSNNGIISYLSLSEKVLNNPQGKPTILIHSNNQNIVFLDTPFYLKDGHGATSILQSEHLNNMNQMFITAVIRRVIQAKYSYNHKATKIELKNTYVQMPVKNGEIDYDFMESFIAELEAERIAELSAYLKVSGFDNYELSEEELNALERFAELGDDNWGTYTVGNLFEKVTTKKLPYKAKELPKQPTDDYVLPCLTSSFQNQGLNYYAPKEGATVINNVISLPSNSDVY